VISRRFKMAEVAKETENKAYEAIEIVKKTGKLKKGINETTKCVEKGIAKLVVYAKDVNPPEVTMHLKPLCDEKDVTCVVVSSKEELGAAAGLDVGTAGVAVIQEGEAGELIKELNSSEKSE
jgi:large subunit ribosomal protein L7Ae